MFVTLLRHQGPLLLSNLLLLFVGGISLWESMITRKADKSKALLLNFYITWGFERAAACTCYVSCSLVEPAWLCFPEVRNRKQTESGLLLIHFTWKPHLKSNELSAPRNLFQLDRSGSSKFITQLSWSLTNFWPFLFPLNSLPSIATASWSGETTILFSTTLKRQFNMRLCAHCAAQE